MRIKKSSDYSLEELEEKILMLEQRKMKMELRRLELENGLLDLGRRLKSLYAKRTIALNLKLPLEEAKS